MKYLRSGILILLLAAPFAAGAKVVLYTVTWDANPPDEEIDRYVVRVSVDDGDVDGWEGPETRADMSTDLPIGVKADVRVKSCNAGGCSEESEPVSFTVEPAGITVPKNLSVIINTTVEIQ